jgi:hypothetical protein
MVCSLALLAISGLLLRLFGVSGLAWFVVAGLVVGLTLWRARQGFGPKSYALVILASVLVSLHTHSYDLTILLPAAALGWEALKQRPVLVTTWSLLWIAVELGLFVVARMGSQFENAPSSQFPLCCSQWPCCSSHGRQTAVLCRHKRDLDARLLRLRRRRSNRLDARARLHRHSDGPRSNRHCQRITALELWAWWQPPDGPLSQASLGTGRHRPYWSAMREGGQWSWLVHDRLTTEPHEPALLYPPYLATAKLAAALGHPSNSPTSPLPWSRAAFPPVGGGTGRHLRNPRRRAATFALVIAGGGLAFFTLVAAAVVRQPDLVGEWAVDWRYIELSTFLALFSYPHHLISLGCLGVLLVIRLNLDSQPSLAALLGLGATLALIALANSFALVPASVGLGLYGLWRIASERRAFAREVAIGAVVVLVISPFLIYTWRTFAQDSFWATAYGVQNVPHLRTPAPFQLLSGLGLLLPFGLIGAMALAQKRQKGWVLLGLWLVVLLALMLLPVSYQRRYGLGMPMLLALLSSHGLMAIAGSRAWRQLPGLVRQLGGYAGFLCLFSSAIGIMILVSSLALTGRGAESVLPVFESAEVVEATRWLAEESTPEDVVLAEWRTANVALRYIPGRAVSAHPSPR